MGVSQNYGYHFGGLIMKGSHNFGKVPYHPTKPKGFFENLQVFIHQEIHAPNKYT